AFWLSIPIGLLPIWLSGEAVSSSTIVANFSMIPNVLGYPSIIGVYWTLATELAFYGICLAFFLLRIIDKSATFAWMIVVAGAGQWVCDAAIRWAARAQLLAPDDIGIKMRLAKYFIDPQNAWQSANNMLFAYLSVMALGTLCRFWHDGKLQDRFARC